MPKFILGKIWKNYNHNPTGVDDDETVSLLVDIGSSGEGVVRPGVCSWVPSARSSTTGRASVEVTSSTCSGTGLRTPCG